MRREHAILAQSAGRAVGSILRALGPPPVARGGRARAVRRRSVRLWHRGRRSTRCQRRRRSCARSPLPALAPLDAGADPRLTGARSESQRGDTIGSVLARARRRRSRGARSSCAPIPAARPLYQLRPGQSLRVETDDDGTLLSLRFLTASGDLLTIARDRRQALARRRAAAPVEVRWAVRGRRDPHVAVRRRGRGRPSRRGHAAARRRVRRRHRLLSRPAARRPLHRRLRDALRRRRAGRQRGASSPPNSSNRGKTLPRVPLARRATAAKATTAPTAPRCTVRSCARRWNSRASRRDSRCARFHPILQHVARAPGRRLRGADRHAGARDRRRHRGLRRRSRAVTATSIILRAPRRVLDGLCASVALRRASQAGRARARRAT